MTLPKGAFPADEPDSDESAQPNGRRTSQLLRDFGETGPHISLGALRDALDDRGFGVLLFVFAFPNLLPHNIPLVSAVLGLPLILLAAQLSYGRHKPWFPSWLAERSFPRLGFAAIVMHALPYLERAERLLKPRLMGLLSWTGERFIGIAPSRARHRADFADPVRQFPAGIRHCQSVSLWSRRTAWPFSWASAWESRA
jgi:hypothetical protein